MRGSTRSWPWSPAGWGCSAALTIPELQDQIPKTWSVRSGKFKAYYDKRAEKPFVLFDLTADPGETRDVSAEHPELAAALTKTLGERIGEDEGGGGAAIELDPEDEARLRELGYIN